MAGFFSSTPGSMVTSTSKSPYETALTKAFSDYVAGQIGKGATPYTGEFTAPATEQEQLGLANLSQYLTAQPSDLQTYGLGQYKEALAGLTPGATEEWYNKYMMPIRRRAYETEIAPQVAEQYVTPGLFYSKARAEGGAKAAEQFGEQGLQELGQTIMSERAAARGMLSQLPAMTALTEEAPLRKAAAAMQYGGLERGLAQDTFDKMYAEFVRTSPESNPLLQYAASLSGIPLGEQTSAYYQQGQTSPFMQLVSALAPAAGSIAGAGMTSGATNSLTKALLAAKR